MVIKNRMVHSGSLQSIRHYSTPLHSYSGHYILVDIKSRHILRFISSHCNIGRRCNLNRKICHLGYGYRFDTVDNDDVREYTRPRYSFFYWKNPYSSGASLTVNNRRSLIPHSSVIFFFFVIPKKRREYEVGRSFNCSQLTLLCSRIYASYNFLYPVLVVLAFCPSIAIK